VSLSDQAEYSPAGPGTGDLGLRVRAEAPSIITQTGKEGKVLIMGKKETKLNLVVVFMALAVVAESLSL
jgi:hypothetical protein